MLDWYWYLLLMLAGFLAGIVNTIAGGGTFLTLPALMLICGLDVRMANGTNRVAILFSSLIASITFHRHGKLDKRQALKLAVPTLLGVPLGVLLAIQLPTEAFEPLVGIIFLAMALVILSNPKRFTEKRTTEVERPVAVFLVFFGIGVYVGFIQAGMGILLLLAMGLLNTGDLVASNAIKNLIGFGITLVATLFFAISGYVDWVPGLVIAGGNIFGGLLGAKLAIAKGAKLIFGFLVVVMVATGIKLIAGY